MVVHKKCESYPHVQKVREMKFPDFIRVKSEIAVYRDSHI